jgi:hypothetical protein
MSWYQGALSHFCDSNCYLRILKLLSYFFLAQTTWLSYYLSKRVQQLPGEGTIGENILDNTILNGYVEALIPLEFGHHAKTCLSPCEVTLLTAAFGGFIGMIDSQEQDENMETQPRFNVKSLICTFAEHSWLTPSPGISFYSFLSLVSQ